MGKECVIIPTLNEGETIGKLLEGIPDKTDVYVIDGLSKDRTVEIARRKGAKIILVTEKGKGRAVGVAMKKLAGKYEKMVMLDGDMTYDPGDIPKFLERLEKCDVVFGKRFPKKGSMSILHRWGNFSLTLTAKILFKNKAKDLCTGYIGFGKKALEKIKFKAEGFELEANIFAQSVKKRLKICHIPVDYSPSPAQSKLNSFSDGFRIVKMLFRERFSE